MARSYKMIGEGVLSRNYSVTTQTPLDLRQVVDSEADLIKINTWNGGGSGTTAYIYSGLITVIKSTGELFVLTTNSDHSDASDSEVFSHFWSDEEPYGWKRIDAGSSIQDIENIKNDIKDIQNQLKNSTIVYNQPTWSFADNLITITDSKDYKELIDNTLKLIKGEEISIEIQKSAEDDVYTVKTGSLKKFDYNEEGSKINLSTGDIESSIVVDKINIEVSGSSHQALKVTYNEDEETSHVYVIDLTTLSNGSGNITNTTIQKGGDVYTYNNESNSYITDEGDTYISGADEAYLATIYNIINGIGDKSDPTFTAESGKSVSDLIVGEGSHSENKISVDALGGDGDDAGKETLFKGSKINSKYLPSYVDDVIEAEFTIHQSAALETDISAQPVGFDAGKMTQMSDAGSYYVKITEDQYLIFTVTKSGETLLASHQISETQPEGGVSLMKGDEEYYSSILSNYRNYNDVYLSLMFKLGTNDYKVDIHQQKTTVVKVIQDIDDSGQNNPITIYDDTLPQVINYAQRGVIYIDVDTNISYRWTGGQFVSIGGGSSSSVSTTGLYWKTL